MAEHGADGDDIVEQGGAPLRLPEWARRPRWLPALGRCRSRGAAVLGIAGLIAGYLGRSPAFDEALLGFAHAYAIQNQRDYDALVEAVRAGTIVAAPAGGTAAP